MSGDGSNASAAELPEPVSDWLADVAAERGLSEEELLSRLLAGPGGNVSNPDEIDDRLSELQSAIEGLESRIDDMRADTDAKIDDVRERVIQVKREADAKADREHDHPDLDAHIEDIDDDLDALADGVDDLEERLSDSVEEVAAETADLREDVETVSADVSEKLTVLAVAVVEMRDQVRDLLADRRRRALAAELQTTANRSGIRRATCESCESGVEIGLLTEPRCPHCNEPLEELDPKDGFFGTDYLRTGHAPALEAGETGEGDSDLEEIIEE